MKRTTIALPDEVLDRLRSIAAEEQISLAAVIREALTEHATRCGFDAGRQPKPLAVSVFDSDTGETNADERPMPKSIGIIDSDELVTGEQAGEAFSFGEPVGGASTEPRAAEKQPKLCAVGVFDSGTTDTAELSADWRIYEPPEWRS